MRKKAKRLKKETSKFKKRFLTVLEIFFIVLMIASAIEIYIWFKDNQNNKDLQNEISKNITIDTNEQDAGENDKYKVNFEALKEINSDIIGWLKVNGTQVEYTVVKTNNNWFYLNHSFDKSFNYAGWIFADYKNKFDGTDKNIVIYGHNRRDGSMFGTLKNILNPEWYNNENNKTIYFITETGNSSYEVFSVYQIESEDYYIATNFTEKSYEKFLETIKKRSIKNFGVEVTKDDNILTLSTCANDNKYRVVLHAKKINDEE